MNSIRLSICISTLNRAAYIGETIESILAQLTDEVEVIILDGTSTDNTAETVKSYEARCSGLRYVRLEKPEGFDEKYCMLAELARGEYCWMFADDDLLKPGAVAAVLEATRRNYSLIIVNAEVRNKDLSVRLQARRVNAEEDRVYAPKAPDWNHLLADTGVYLTYIGAIVMKRQVWNQRERVKYFGTLFVHMGVIYQSPLPGDTLVMAEPWIVIRYGNALWTPQSFEIWMFKFPELIWSFPGFADWAKECVERREPWRSWLRLLTARAMGHYSLQEYQRWLKPRLANSPYKLLCCAIAKAPAAPLNLLARLLVKYVFRKSPSMTLHDLERWQQAPT